MPRRIIRVTTKGLINWVRYTLAIRFYKRLIKFLKEFSEKFTLLFNYINFNNSL